MKWSMAFTIMVGISVILTGCATHDRYSAVSAHSGKCLSLTVPGEYYDGDPVEQWDCLNRGFCSGIILMDQWPTFQQ